MLKINGANAWWWWFRTADSAMFLTISQKTHWRFFRMHLLHRCNSIFHAFFFIDLIILTFHSQPTQILAKTSQERLNFDLKDVLDWSEMEVATTFFSDNVVNTSSTRRPQDVFQKTSSRPLPGDLLKTSSRRPPQYIFQKISSRPLPEDALKISLRRLKTSRLFLVKAKDHLETTYGLSIYVCFKLLTYYHSTTSQTNWINLNKLNTLEHGNNAEIMKTWFYMNYQTR